MTYVDFPVDDPGGQGQATVRRIVADLGGRLHEVLVEVVPDIDLPLGEVYVGIALEGLTADGAWASAFMRGAW